MDIPSISLYNRPTNGAGLQQANKVTEFSYDDWNAQGTQYLKDYSRRLEENTYHKLSSQLNDVVGTHVNENHVVKVDLLNHESKAVDVENYKDSMGIGALSFSLTSDEKSVNDVLPENNSISAGQSLLQNTQNLSFEGKSHNVSLSMQSVISSTAQGILEIEGVGTIGGASHKMVDTVVSSDDSYDGKLSEGVQHHSALTISGTASDGSDIYISLSLLEERYQSSAEIYESEGLSTKNISSLNAEGKSERLVLQIESKSGIQEDTLKELLSSAQEAIAGIKIGGLNSKSVSNISELFSSSLKDANINIRSQDDDKNTRAVSLSISNHQGSGRILANNSSFEADKPRQLFTPRPAPPAQPEPIHLDMSNAGVSIQDMIDHGMTMPDEVFSALGATAEDFLKLRDIK